jgi:sirohydrochlorin cobaltochelatase
LLERFGKVIIYQLSLLVLSKPQPMRPKTMNKAMLVLVAHGSEQRPESVGFLFELARSLNAGGEFAEVVPLLVRGQPSVTTLSAALDRVDPSVPVVIVPVFMGRGYYSDVLVPRVLSPIIAAHPHHRVVWSEPLGCHPQMADKIADSSVQAALTVGLVPKKSALMLVGHGSRRPEGSGKTPQKLAWSIGQMGIFCRVEVSFLEQAPKAVDWATLCPTENLLVMPLLLSTGLHGSKDIPEAFGFANQSGMRVDDQGRIIVLSGGVGLEHELVSMVSELARAALRAFLFGIESL